ncbi:MAG: hypothetical protein KJZ84_19150 [Bryobacteraceae bacterium]|nr:hypothetical protein [Bryobacteraceae bacterium]
MTATLTLLLAFIAPGLDSDAKQEHFLLKAKIVEMRPSPGGITRSKRATLRLGGTVHDAHIQQIRQEKAREYNLLALHSNFIDSYRGNVAAYRLDRMLGLNMTPVSVERRVGGISSAVTWWVDDILMPVSQLKDSGLEAPDPEDWQRKNDMMRLFDALIANPDRNTNNMLITRQWDLALIDHTRAFRWNPELDHPHRVQRCERRVFKALKSLTKKEVERSLGGLLAGFQIDGLMARRDAIVARLEQLIQQRGEDAVLFGSTVLL